MRSLSLYRLGWRRIRSHYAPQPCAFSTSLPLKTASEQLTQTTVESTQTAIEQSTPSKKAAEHVDFPALDKKWQLRWKIGPSGSDLRMPTREKAYVLPMFPYPSGTLHLGHLRVYTISDVIARFMHLRGHQVLHPIGWDAFGLPAENAAIERGVSPEKWTLQNIQTMKEQMMAMGGQWEWDREFRTCDPEFYKHTQLIFLMLHKRGLAYQAESLVNYDPVDKTVLANEQVDVNGCSWRSGAKVQKVMLKQWFLKIKEFQEPLLKDLETLAENGDWPERVLTMQRNWLGRSEGTKLWFVIQSEHPKIKCKPIDVFTTRADTLFGVQYIALSLNHPVVQELARQDEALRAFLQRAPHLPPDSREGYLLPGVTARNPVSTISNADGVSEPLPVYAAPYVLDDYGSGAVMGVPGHDTRDHAFWRANAGDAAIKVVITPKVNTVPQPLIGGHGNDTPMVKRGHVAANIDVFADLTSAQAVEEIISKLKQSGQLVKKTENWRLRDWLISRQRYWGTPIPIIHCKDCGPVPVPETDLPVLLPSLPDTYFQGKAGNPLAEDAEWKKTNCPKCGSSAERETDTMDTFMDSSWYFFRFLAPKGVSPFAKGLAGDMPVDVYVGGVEHAILHLLYARFISKFLATTPLWTEGQEVKGEPIKKLITQGMVHGMTYSDPETGRFLRPEEVDKTNPSTPVIISNGLSPKVSYEKMSKSKYNGVDPGRTIATYGADVTRAHMLFQAPVSDVLEWDETSITGVQRWLARVLELSKAPFLPLHLLRNFKTPTNLDRTLMQILYVLRNCGALKPIKLPYNQHSPFATREEERVASLGLPERKFWIETQKRIASVTESYSATYSLNTIVSDLMTLTNLIETASPQTAVMAHMQWYATAHLLRMLAPIAPAVAEEGWEVLHKQTGGRVAGDVSHPLHIYDGPSIFAWGFPSSDQEGIRLLSTTMTCVFSVDGKKKFEVEISKIPKTVIGVADIGRWVLQQLSETDSGKEWLEKGDGKVWKISNTEEAHPFFEHVPKTWHVVAAKGGTILNVVSPKKKSNKASAVGDSTPKGGVDGKNTK